MFGIKHSGIKCGQVGWPELRWLLLPPCAWHAVLHDAFTNALLSSVQQLLGCEWIKNHLVWSYRSGFLRISSLRNGTDTFSHQKLVTTGAAGGGRTLPGPSLRLLRTPCSWWSGENRFWKGQGPRNCTSRTPSAPPTGLCFAQVLFCEAGLTTVLSRTLKGKDLTNLRREPASPRPDKTPLPSPNPSLP